MTKTEQKHIINQLCDQLKKDMVYRLPRMPDDWNGKELRQLMADIAQELFNAPPMARKRMAEYKNTRIITPNL